MAQPSPVSNILVVNLLNRRRFLVQWSKNPELDIASYNIYRAEAQFSGFALVGSVGIPSTQFIDTVPFTFGVNFYYKVTAVNSSGQESDITVTEAVTDSTINSFDEEPFKQVVVQKQDLIFGEIPMGLANNANVTYTTLFPFRAGSLQFIKNGLILTETGANPDYIEFIGGTGFTVAIPPHSTDNLRVNYVKFFD